MHSTNTPTIDFNQCVTRLRAWKWTDRDAREEQWRPLKDGGRAVLNAMKQGFAHGDWRVRRECVEYMDHHADESCVRGLLKALKDTK